MSFLRRAVRRDDVESGIIRALTGFGCSVQPLTGRGVPDLLVGFRGVNVLLECKAPAKPGPRGGAKAGGLNDDQEKWHREWRGATPAIARSAAEAIAAVLNAAGIETA